MSEFDGCEEYTVTVTLEWDEHNDRMVILEDWRNRSMERDRHHGPAVVKRDPKTGDVIEAQFWRNDVQMFPEKNLSFFPEP